MTRAPRDRRVTTTSPGSSPEVEARARRRGPSTRALTVVAVVASVLVALWLGDVIGHVIRGTASPAALSNQRAAGLADAAAGDCAGVLNLLPPVVAADASDVDAKTALGNCYLALHQFAAAVPLLESVASFQRDRTNELALANAAFFTGASNLVESSVATAVTLSTNSSELLSLAQTAQGYGLYRLSSIALDRVRSRGRGYEWYDVDAQTQLDLGFPTSAVNAARTGASLSPPPERGATWTDEGEIDEGAGHYRAAVTSFRRALALSGRSEAGSIYEELAQCYTVLGRYPAALTASERGILTTTKGPPFALELDQAVALGDLHHTKRAEALLERIVANPSASANTVESASVLLSTLRG